jgi:hypothetical protein
VKEGVDAEPNDLVSNARLAVYEHHYACSSAYWDPTGRHVVSTSYDDTCPGSLEIIFFIRGAIL